MTALPAARIRPFRKLIFQAAACAALALVSTGAARAQSAVETVAYLVLGKDPAAAPDNFLEQYEFVIEDGVINFTSRMAKTGAVMDELTIQQDDDCSFKITGQDFAGGRRINVNNSIDFTDISPTEDMRNFTVKGVWGDTTFYYFNVEGVEVCTNGAGENDPNAQFPPAGTCQKEFRTRTFLDAKGRDRMSAALNHLRANYCKPRAF